MNLKLKAELKKILDDKKSGSTEILYKLNKYFLANFKSIPDFPSMIIESKKHLAQFEIIIGYLHQLEKYSLNPDALLKFLKRYKSSSSKIFDDIFINAFSFLENKNAILTISNSKTVFEILTRLNSKNKLQITICESRPKFEGRILARQFLKSGCKINFITESQIGQNIPKCDCVVIGADKIFKNGDVMNKVGSLSLAIIANHFQKPFYIVSEKNKISGNNSFVKKEENPAEIWNTKIREITIKNFYFEKIPAELITKIITN